VLLSVMVFVKVRFVIDGYMNDTRHFLFVDGIVLPLSCFDNVNIRFEIYFEFFFCAPLWNLDPLKPFRGRKR
jgi:hypothetical protein